MDYTKYVRHGFERQLKIALIDFDRVPFPYLVPSAINDAPNIKRVAFGNLPFFICHFYCCLIIEHFVIYGRTNTERDYYPIPTGILAGDGVPFPPETILLLSTVYPNSSSEIEIATDVVAETSKSICIDMLSRPGKLFKNVLFPSIQDELQRSKIISKLVRFGMQNDTPLIELWSSSSLGFADSFGFELGQNIDLYKEWRDIIISDLQATTHLMPKY